MIVSHKKKANICAGVYLGSMGVLLFLLISGHIEGNVWDGNNPLALTVFLINGGSLAVSMWFFAKSKGYWGILGPCLLLLNVFGLIILLSLPDQKYPKKQ